MNAPRTRDRLALAALAAGVTVPFVYYGLQVLCAWFDPGYSFVRQAASELGSDRAARPGLFNAGIMLEGVLTLVAAAGFLGATLRLGVRPILAFLASAAVAANGVQTLWAGYFPMPDPRHGGHPAFVVAMILLPVLLTAALWKGAAPALKGYFVATLLLLLAVFPFMSGVAGDISNVRGLFQRVFTLTIFPPIAVAAGALIGRLRNDVARDGR